MVYVDIVLGLMCGWVVVIEKVGEGSSCWTLKSNLTFTNGWPTLYELPLGMATWRVRDGSPPSQPRPVYQK